MWMRWGIVVRVITFSLSLLAMVRGGICFPLQLGCSSMLTSERINTTNTEKAAKVHTD